MPSLIADLLRPTRYREAMTNIDVVKRSLGDAERFSFRWRFDDVADGDSVYVRFRVPSDGNSVTALIRQITTEGTARGQIAETFTVDTAGTEREVRNDNIGHDNQPTPSVIVETGGTYSGITDGQDILIPGGTTSGTRSGSLGTAVEGEVQPGADILYELTSQSGTNDIFLSLVWTEDAA